LLGTTRFTDPHVIQFITGQKVTASLSGGGPLTVVTNSQTWSLEGGNVDPFKDYTYGNKGERKDLLTTDYKAPSLGFYSNKDGSITVSCTFNYVLPVGAKFAGGLPAFTAESKQLESVRPRFVNWDVHDGSVLLLSDKIIFGNANLVNNGQEWVNAIIKLDGPFGNVGTGAFCQLINANRNLHRTVTNQTAKTHFVKNPHNATEAIDMGMPYPFGITWTISGQGKGVDSPAQPLVWAAPYTHTWHDSRAVDSFMTWLMYKPPSSAGQPTTYIPIARYTWSWGGQAKRTYSNNSWGPFALQAGAYGGMNDPPVEFFTHPTWTKVSPSPFSFAPVTP
jgi:hypothetical protein